MVSKNTYADDNVCEIMNGNDCSKCSKCNSAFYITPIVYNGDVHIQVAFRQIIGRGKDKEDLVIMPYTEPLTFTYCPFCGKKISERNNGYSDGLDQYIEEIKK